MGEVCKTCGGVGWRWFFDKWSRDPRKDTCERCHGTGRTPEPERDGDG